MFMVIFVSTSVVCLSILLVLLLFRNIRSRQTVITANRAFENGGKFISSVLDEEIYSADNDNETTDLLDDYIKTDAICDQVELPIHERDLLNENVGEDFEDENENNDGELLDVPLPILIDYLDCTYWRNTVRSADNLYTRDNMKPVMRKSKSRRKIHIVYSKNTLLKLAFSKNFNNGLNEKFAFIFKGLKSWSVDETRGRFADVMKDLLEFRQDIIQVFMKHQGNSFDELIPFIQSRPTKIKESESILPVIENPRFYNVVCERERLTFVDKQEPFNWKVVPPRGLEQKIPSVCFVIPFRENEVPGFKNGIEIQYEYLLTLWNNEKPWNIKQSVSSSKITSSLKILKPILSENKNLPKFIENQENNFNPIFDESEEKSFDDIVFPDAIPMPGDVKGGRDVVDEPLCIEDKITLLESEPDMKFDDGGNPDRNKYEIEEKFISLLPIAVEAVTAIDNEDINLSDENDDTTKMNISADRAENMSRDIVSEVNCLSSIDDLLYKLENILRDLNSNNRTSDEHSIPRDVSNLHELHNEIYTRLYPEYRNLTIEASQTESNEIKEKINLLIERWKVTTFTLDESCDRLNNSEVVINTANKLDEFLNHVEFILISQHGITANVDDIQKQHVQLIDLNSKFDSSITSLNKLQRIMESLRDVELSEVDGIIKRWERSLIQVKGRKGKLEEIQNYVLDFRDLLTYEIEWLEGVYKKLESEETVLQTLEKDTFESEKIKKLLNELTVLGQELTEHRKSIQSTFYKAEGLILSSKTYENDLKEFSLLVNGCVDESCRYFIADQSREWIASNTNKLSQLYELILTELPQKINLLLSTLYNQSEHLDYSGDNDELSLSLVYNGDNDVSFWELEKLIRWLDDKESELSKELPSYDSLNDLNSYASKLQKLLECIDKNENWVNLTLNCSHNELQSHSSLLTRPIRENIQFKAITAEMRWSKLQWNIEGCHARMIPLQKLIMSYEKTLKPFQTWLQNVESQTQASIILSSIFSTNKSNQLDPDLSDLDNVKELSLRHERFFNDVTHHVIDLKKLNKYGNMLIVLAKDLQVFLSGFPDSMSSGVDGVVQIWDLERNLFEINRRYKTLIQDLSFHGKLICEYVQKVEDFSEKVDQIVPWITNTESIILDLHLDENLSLERVIFNRELITGLHVDLRSHSKDLVLLNMASDDLTVWQIAGSELQLERGIIIKDKEYMKKTFGMWDCTSQDILARYDNLCKNIIDLEGQLQWKFTMEQHSNDILFDTLHWINTTRESLVNTELTRDKTFLLRQIKFVKMVSQEAERRQCSVELILEKRNEFDNASGNGKENCDDGELLHVLQMLIDLRLSVVGKRELCFTTLTKNVNSFGKWLTGILSHLESLNVQSCDIVTFEKDVMKTIENLERQRENFELINQCGTEIYPLDTNEQNINKLVVHLNKTWREVIVEMINKRVQLNEVLGFVQMYHETFYPLLRWLVKMEECLKSISPVSIHPQILIDQLMEQKVLINDTYSYNSTVEIHNDLAETALYDIIDKYTTQIVKKPIPIELEIRSVRDRYEKILSTLEHRGVHLKLMYTRLEEYKMSCNKLEDWFLHSKHTLFSTNQIGEDLDDIVKHYIDLLRYEEDLKRVSSQVQYTLRLGKELVSGKTDLDGAQFISKQNVTIQQKSDKIKESHSRYQHEIEAALTKTFHQKYRNILLSLKMMTNEAEDITRTKDEAVIVKAVRDLCHDITLYEPALNTLYQAAELLIQRGKVDHDHINELINELDVCCRGLDFILTNCDHFNEKISFNGGKDFQSLKEKMAEEIRDIGKHDNEIPEHVPFKNPFTHVTLTRDLNNKLSWIGRNNWSFFHHSAYPERYTSFKSTVERHTRVSRSHVCNKLHRTNKMVNYLHDPCATFDEEDGLVIEDGIENAFTMPTLVTEKTLTLEDGSNIRKIISTDVRRQERKILRRRYFDDNDNECVEEIEIPDERRCEDIIDEQQWTDDGAVIFKSPEKNQTTTEEEFVRDKNGNITQWIVKKQIRRTKSTRIVKHVAGDKIDIDANSKISVVPGKNGGDMITVSSNNLLNGIANNSNSTSMSIQLDRLIKLYNARKKYVTFLKKNMTSTPCLKRYKAISKSRFLNDIPEEDNFATRMRINPYFVHRLFVSRVIPSSDFSKFTAINPEDQKQIRSVGKESMNLSASIQHPEIESSNQKKYYHGIQLKCIKTSSNEETHICPEHNIIEEQLSEPVNGKRSDTTENKHIVKSRRKGFRLIMKTSDEDKVVYEGDSRSYFQVKPHTTGRLIVKDIITSPIKDVVNGDEESHNTSNISLISKPNNLQEEKSIKVHATNSKVKASITKSSSNVNNITHNTPSTISITVDADGNHDSVHDEDKLDGYKRLRKITVTPTKSNKPNSQKYKAKLRFKSNNIHAVIFKHPSKYPCHSETVTLQDVGYEKTDIIRETEIIDETSIHNVSSSADDYKKFDARSNGDSKIKETISYSNTFVTKTESVVDDDKTIVHISVRSKNGNKAE